MNSCRDNTSIIYKQNNNPRPKPLTLCTPCASCIAPYRLYHPVIVLRAPFAILHLIIVGHVLRTKPDAAPLDLRFQRNDALVPLTLDGHFLLRMNI